MIINVLLLGVVVVLCGMLYEYRKEKTKDIQKIYDLEIVIKTYDVSEKVIKDCVVYSTLPVTISGNGLAFMGCTFADMGQRPATPELKEILGI